MFAHRCCGGSTQPQAAAPRALHRTPRTARGPDGAVGAGGCWCWCVCHMFHECLQTHSCDGHTARTRECMPSKMGCNWCAVPHSTLVHTTHSNDAQIQARQTLRCVGTYARRRGGGAAGWGCGSRGRGGSGHPGEGAAGGCCRGAGFKSRKVQLFVANFGLVYSSVWTMHPSTVPIQSAYYSHRLLVGSAQLRLLPGCCFLSLWDAAVRWRRQLRSLTMATCMHRFLCESLHHPKPEKSAHLERLHTPSTSNHVP